MIKLYGEGMEEHFGVGVAFNIIHRTVQLLHNRLLLTDIRHFIDTTGKIISTGFGRWRNPEPDTLFKQVIEI